MTARLTIILLAACSETQAPPAPPVPTSPPMSDAWVTATSAKHVTVLDSQASVVGELDATVAVSAVAPTRIESIAAAPGQEVAKGKALLVVTIPELARQASQYAGASTLRAALAKQKRELAGLVAEGLIAKRELRTVTTRIAELDAQILKASAALKALGSSPGNAWGLARSGGRQTVRSPRAGTIQSLDAVVGQHYSVGSVFARVTAGESRRVRAEIPLPRGKPLTPTFVAATGQHYGLKLIHTAPAADPRTGLVQAWYILPETPLPIGTPGSLQFRFPESIDIAEVPSSAITQESDGDFVWKRSPDGPLRVAVTVLGSARGFSVITGDIKTGDKVARDPRSFEGQR